MRKLTFLMLFAVMGMVAEAQISRYIKVIGTGDSTGTSWSNASGRTQIQARIDEVALNANKGTVYFAAGTYYLGATITIKDGVNCFGGYSSDGSTRDLMLHQSILDGQDTRRVLTINGGDNALFTKSTIIDGFVIQRGKDNYGPAASIGFRILLRNCIIRNNRETGTGSGYGAIFMKATNASATFNGSIANCLIINNTTSRGVIFTSGDSKTFSIVNCVIANNKVNTMSPFDKNFNSNGITLGNWTHATQIINNILWNNTGPSYSLPFRISNGTLGDVRNNIVEKQRDSISNNINASLTNYYSAPTFANPTTFVGHATNSTQTTELNNSDWRLKSGSQGINSGYSGQLKDRATMSGTTEVLRNYTDYLSTDIMGNSRFISTTPEIGSYEYDPITSTVSSSNNDYGTVNSNQEVSKGSLITQTATPSSGYHFVNWTESGSEVSTNATYTFTASTNRTLVANFEPNTVPVSSGTTNAADITCTTCDVTVAAGAELSVGATKTLKSVTVAAGGKLTITAGNLNVTNGITLESTADATATILDSYSTPTITATVKQQVSAGRNWYLSSPVSAADYSWLSRGTSVQGWNEATKAWVPVTNGTLVRGKGYVQVATSTPEITGTTGTVNVTGTTNSGDVAITVSRTESGSSRGFNLVGNPYPSYLKWTGENGFLADATNDSISTSFWYRTKNTDGAYVFTTYNGSSHLVVGGTSVNSVLNEYIPPMQAFWIRVDANTAVTTHNVSLTFKNNMRFHGVGDNNKFKAPKVDDRQLVRLQLANGSQSDEALVYFDASAANTFDNYDSPKMMNNSTILPDLYTTTGVERLAINGLNELTDNMELPLGFTLKAAITGLKLKVSELSNLTSGTKVYLLDKEQGSQTELLPSTEYSFNTSTATTNNESRFSLLFKAPGVTTGTNSANNERISVSVNAANQITISAAEKSNYAIYNALGQLIENGVLKSELQTVNCKLQTGIFVVKINNQSTRVIIK